MRKKDKPFGKGRVFCSYINAIVQLIKLDPSFYFMINLKNMKLNKIHQWIEINHHTIGH